MDVVPLVRSLYHDYGVVLAQYCHHFIDTLLRTETYIYTYIGVLLLFWSVGVISYKKWMRQRNNAVCASMSSATVGTGDMRLRFRKRDKMLFYGRRMLRKVKNVSGQMYGGQGRKRRAVMRFAKRILHLRRETMPAQMKTVEPPAEYLEETMEGSDRVPPDAVYMLQSIRIFGHFEKPIFLELCKHTEMQYLDAGDYLFNISEPDDSVFIVQSGLINVCISNLDGSTLTLKTVKKGESVTSLLSFINVLAEYPSYYKSVTARAVEKSVVIRLPMQAFKDVFNENPDIMIRVIQVIMVRLERVLITVLRKYLGLNSELVQNHMRPRKSIANMQQQQQQHKGSPIHRRSQGENIQHTLSDIRHPLPPDMLIDLSTDFMNFNTQQAIDSKLVRATGVENFVKELGLSETDRELIEPYVQIREVESGETLVTEGNADDVCLWFVITGNLVVYQHTFKQLRGPKSDKIDNYIHHVHPGEIVGGMAVLTGEASPFTIKSKVFSRIAFIRRPDVYNIMRERPNIVLDIGNGVVRRLSPLVRQCDYALDWIILESGRALFRQDEMSDSTYIVLSGRLRSIITHSNGKKKIAGEYGKGDLVGIVEMITETCRTSTVLAVRDSELARLPEGLFNAIKLRYPVVVTKLISLLSHRMLGSMQTCDSSTTPLDANPVTHKYSTVALVPITDDVPLTALTYELYHSLCAIGPTLRLTSEVVRKQLGAQIFDANNEYRLTSWLAQQEDRNIITLYQCDTILSPWTKRCMRQSDVVLIIGLGDVSPVVGKFEREIDRIAMRTQKELVLLYSEASNAKPSNTLQWLNVRPWVTRHHHIQCAKRIFTRKSQFRLNDLYSRVLMSEPNMHSDLSRLARWLSGNSIGVVLGGGGARGAAHIGMLKAIQESGIPIDMVGGVSIGALMGALWCADRNITTVTQKAREWCKQMTNWFLQLLDLTYPITSMFSGKEFNKTIRNTLGEVSIEDLWIPYFTLTTDITSSCHRIHTNGALWRYVRASMTIAGVLPPLCDYKDGHLLLDGCYANNVPADVMHNLGAAHIIAIDVGSQDDTDLTNYGDNLSGWWLLYKKWNPFTTPVKVPDLPDIQSRLAYVSCVRQLAEVKKSDYCEYIRPPIDKYKTLAFGSFDEIRDVGYVFGKNYFENMAKAGRMGRFKKWFRHEPPKRHNHSTLSEYTFIDLAEIVCKRPETYVEIDHNHIYSLSDDEDYDGYISEPSTYNRNRKMRVNANSASLSLSENEMDSDIELDLKFSTTKMKLKNDAMVLDSLSPDSNHETERLSDNEDATKSEVVTTATVGAVDEPTLSGPATAARESAQETNIAESTEPQ